MPRAPHVALDLRPHEGTVLGPQANSRFRWKHPCIEQKHRQRLSLVGRGRPRASISDVGLGLGSIRCIQAVVSLLCGRLCALYFVCRSEVASSKAVHPHGPHPARRGRGSHNSVRFVNPKFRSCTSSSVFKDPQKSQALLLRTARGAASWQLLATSHAHCPLIWRVAQGTVALWGSSSCGVITRRGAGGGSAPPIIAHSPPCSPWPSSISRPPPPPPHLPPWL
jgi:hypothetical protein